MTALPMSTRRKPKRRITGVAVARMVIAPAALAKVMRPESERVHAEPDLQHQRQQERQRADADAEERAADDRGEEGRDPHQRRDR